MTPAFTQSAPNLDPHLLTSTKQPPDTHCQSPSAHPVLERLHKHDILRLDVGVDDAQLAARRQSREGGEGEERRGEGARFRLAIVGAMGNKN